MLLNLRILSYRGNPVPADARGRFDEAGGAIGRAPDNDLVLDDPVKYISRVHARVVFRDGAYFLEDTGSNPSIVNDRPLGRGRNVMLGHGDRIVIGEYLLQAALDEGVVAAPRLPSAPFNNPELPLFVPPPVPVAAPLLPLDFVSRDAQLAVQTPLPDILAAASILDGAAGAQFGTDDPLGLNLLGAALPKTSGRAAESDHVSPELVAFHMSAPACEVLPARRVQGALAIPANYNPLDDFSPIAGPTESELPSVPAFDIAAPAPAPAAIAPSAPASDNEILKAMLRGLGLPNLKVNYPATELAETVGAMLREAAAGTIDVLMARALTKQESRIEVTMLTVHSNNPLKFFPNADAALTQMLTGAMAGYMPPVQAMASAFDDLRAHELAVIAGMRSALSAVLHRFDPASIEERLALPTMLDKMLSTNRKAKMWDRLVELYGEIAREADDDLQRLFGEKFSEAYEEQVARLHLARKNPSNL